MKQIQNANAVYAKVNSGLEHTFKTTVQLSKSCILGQPNLIPTNRLIHSVHLLPRRMDPHHPEILRIESPYISIWPGIKCCSACGFGQSTLGAAKPFERIQ